MLLIVSASNRRNSLTYIIARYVYEQIKKEAKIDCAFYDLTSLPADAIHDLMYEASNQSESLKNIQDKQFIPATKFWFFVPEYNGSIPGTLKVLLDCLSVREIQKTFAYKKACLTGIASGRAGNLRGIDHLADILNHLNVVLLPNRLPISSVHNLLNEDKELVDVPTIESLKAQKVDFLSF